MHLWPSPLSAARALRERSRAEKSGLCVSFDLCRRRRRRCSITHRRRYHQPPTLPCFFSLLLDLCACISWTCAFSHHCPPSHDPTLYTHSHTTPDRSGLEEIHPTSPLFWTWGNHSPSGVTSPSDDPARRLKESCPWGTAPLRLSALGLPSLARSLARLLWTWRVWTPPRVRAPTTHPHTARPAAPPPAGCPRAASRRPVPPTLTPARPPLPRSRRRPSRRPLPPPPVSPDSRALARRPSRPSASRPPFCCFHRSLFLLVVVGASGVQVRQNLAWPAHAATSPRVTASHPNSEVKLGRVEVVLSSGRGWEGSMLQPSSCARRASAPQRGKIRERS